MVDEQKLQELLKQFPLDWNIRFRLLDLLQSRGAQREVVHFIDGATRPPDDLASLQKIIDLCVWAQDPAVAWRHLDDYLRDHPDSSRTHYLMAKLLVRLDNLALARRHYQRAVALEPQLQSDALEDKLAGRTYAEPAPAQEVAPAYADPYEVESTAAAPTPPPANRPRPITPPVKPSPPVTQGRTPLVPLIDAKTEPVKLPPPKRQGMFHQPAPPQSAPAQAPQFQTAPPPPAPQTQAPAVYQTQKLDPVPVEPHWQPLPTPQGAHAAPAHQDAYPGTPPPPPVEPAPPVYEPEPEAYYDEEEVYQEEPMPESYEEEGVEDQVAAEQEQEPQQLGTVAPLRPPVVQTGWNFLGTQQQQKRKVRPVREPEVTTYERYERRPRKPAAVQLTMLALLVVLGHASFLIAPLYVVSEIPEAAIEIVTSIVP